MAYKLGLDAKIFHGAAGQTASTEMTNVTDVTLNLETGEADITTRAAEGWRITAATLKEASVEFEMIWDTEDSGFNAIQSAYFGNSALSLFVTDGEGNGLDADFVVTSFSRSTKVGLQVTDTFKASSRGSERENEVTTKSASRPLPSPSVTNRDNAEFPK